LTGEWGSLLFAGGIAKGSQVVTKQEPVIQKQEPVVQQTAFFIQKPE
jgi:hypothetical protein